MTDKKLPFKEIADAALNRAEALVPAWLPDGRREGHEWKALNPTRGDTKIGSFSINLNTGRWGDFADHDAQGGDLVSLYAYLFTNRDQGDAAYELAEQLGISMPPRKGDQPVVERKPRPAPPPAPTKPKVDKEWIPMLPVPDGAPPRDPITNEYAGLPERSWAYRDAEGRLLGYVDRIRHKDGSKDVIPLTYCQQEGTNARRWRNKSFPEPRPLYGLDRLAAKPDATVLVVEGEKCADAATEELPDLVVIAWPGGGKAVDKVDWSPLAGRRVMFWPDCDSQREKPTTDELVALVGDDELKAMPAGKDRNTRLKSFTDQAHHKDAIEAFKKTKPLLPADKQPGIMAMEKAAAIVLGLEGAKCWMVEIPPPGEMPDGWDVADAIEAGLQGEELAQWIKDRCRVLKPADQVAAEAQPASAGSAETAADPGPAAAGQGESEGKGEDGGSWWLRFLPAEARQQLLRNDKFKLIDCRENIYTILKHDSRLAGALAIDEFARNIVTVKALPWEGSEAGHPWQENDNLRLGFWLAQNYGLVIRNELNLQRAVAWIAEGHSFHPVREYLDSLEWDNTPRIDSWLTDFLGVRDSEYARLSGRLFLIAMVARIYKPGCLMRSMPILEGDQYRGKSTVLRILGGEWFSDAPFDLRNKDTYQLIQGVWLYEVAELDAFSKAESTAMKAFVSSPKDRFRAPYDREPKDWKRQVVFAGTTNQDVYFKDPTGNTRYWPWKTGEVEEINHAGLRDLRDQLFAEAVALFKAGERWHPTLDEQERLFTPQQADREIEEPWEVAVHKYLMDTITSSRCTTTELLIGPLKVEMSKIDGNKQMSTRVGNIMKRLGWQKKRETFGAREWYYAMPEGWRESNRQPATGGSNAPSF